MAKIDFSTFGKFLTYYNNEFMFSLSRYICKILNNPNVHLQE